MSSHECSALPSGQYSRAIHVHRVINQSLHLFRKSHRVRQQGMAVERGFIFPARMDIEESRISTGAESIDAEASRLLPGWS